MSELWINFLQKEAVASEMPGTSVDGPVSPVGASVGGGEPGIRTPMGGKQVYRRDE